MSEFSLSELEENYNLELDRVVKLINKKGHKTVLLQFPDGMKPYAMPISDFIEEQTSAKVTIWLGSCFGACDIPETNHDLLVQFGHAPWNLKEFNEI